MQINIYSKNVEVTDKLRSYAERKFDRLDRYLPYITDLSLELAQERHRQGGDRAVAQLTIRDKRGTILRAEDKAQGDHFVAIDNVIDKIYRQISRYKGKRRRRAGEKFATLEPEFAAAEEVPGLAETAEEEQMQEAVVARRKHIEIIPMTEQEAIDQLELLGHDFFVFYNAELGRLNVLYRRKSGDFGILDPEVS
ncbi:MAG: ribosome-associated translation inhibitor RaiA [Anaerolineae bacterium]|nr:ribosome-associated translation inhibitor RaiA [Anaerolineae bacterium]